jgi:parallel beta-helix repeat protein
MKTDVLVWLVVLAIMMCTLSTSIFVVDTRIATGTSNSGFNEKVTALQADQEVRFNGTAVEYFSSTGSSGWNVQVEAVSSGPAEIIGHTVTVALWSVAGVPSGTIDPAIEPGDKVAVYGLYMDDDYVTLSESEAYYITKIAAENPPSVSISYPNGGESITTGTALEVSAHATDDKAVTSVTFYYSSDGGSNWIFIGAGARTSGSATDGVWTRTWDTGGLSAGTNYVIKAVASDGTATSEDRSDRTFTVTSSTQTTTLIRVPEDYATIQAAVDAASSGSTITVTAGTYVEHVVIAKSLKVIGAGRSSTRINGSESGNCVHITANNVEISGFTIESGDNGIYVESSDNCSVDNNSISDNSEGIYLRDSNNNLITHNSLTKNIHYLCAIHLSASNDNVIRDNDIFENGKGVYVYNSNHNLIYHNNFEDNTNNQAYDNTGTNSWDKGASVGGNYWSDHTCTGNPSDGSQPYSINSNSIDHYPFQKQSGWVTDNQLPIADSSGAISVTSSPSGAIIELDCFVGPTITTPYTFTNVPAGTHTIKLSLEGYPDWSTSVHVIAGTTSSVHATLTPMAGQTSTTPQPSTGKTHTGEDLSSIPVQAGMVSATEQKVEEIGGTPSGGVTEIQLWALYNGAWTKDPAALYYGEWTYMLLYLDQGQEISTEETYPNEWVSTKDWEYLSSGYHYHQWFADAVGWHKIVADDGSATGQSNEISLYVWPV